jgi:lycopene cyclase domain-containing protein
VIYLWLNLAVLGSIAALGAWFWVKQQRATKLAGAATVILVFLIAVVGDNFIIANGIVAYDVSKLAGVYLGTAPIEDFAYTVASVILVPAVWMLSRRGRK